MLAPIRIVARLKCFSRTIVFILCVSMGRYVLVGAERVGMSLLALKRMVARMKCGPRITVLPHNCLNIVGAHGYL